LSKKGLIIPDGGGGRSREIRRREMAVICISRMWGKKKGRRGSKGKVVSEKAGVCPKLPYQASNWGWVAEKRPPLN